VVSAGIGVAQIEMARRLLAHEGAATSPAECAASASRVYEKIDAQLAPILGAAGVRALFARSAKFAEERFPFLDASAIESSAMLRECLQAQDVSVAADAAALLFGALFALLTTFIGERLTTQVLRRAWPTIEQMTASTSPEAKK
jgi:hypothetical protein